MVTSVNGSVRRARIVWFWLATIVGGGCDLQTKNWAEAVPGGKLSVIEPWLDVHLAYNRGMAFSVVDDLGSLRWLFGLLALAAVVFLFVSVLRSGSTRSEALLMGLIAGGALGNGLDRAFRTVPGGGTGVVDFIKVNYPWGGSWPTFNVADVLLVVGVGVLLIRALAAPRTPPAVETATP